jgi:hypothetical protein
MTTTTQTLITRARAPQAAPASAGEPRDLRAVKIPTGAPGLRAQGPAWR